MGIVEILASSSSSRRENQFLFARQPLGRGPEWAIKTSIMKGDELTSHNPRYYTVYTRTCIFEARNKASNEA